jgi:lipoprotein-anchoring transpeptidase ErfK/SrfK
MPLVPVAVIPVAVEPEQFIAPPAPVAQLAPVLTMATPAFPPAIDAGRITQQLSSAPRYVFELFHRYTVIAFAILLLLIGSTGTTVAGHYIAVAQAQKASLPAGSIAQAPVIAGLNLTVPATELEAKLQAITGQTASLTVGDKAEPISPDTIKSWLQITQSPDKSQNFIHIKADTINTSLLALANKHATAAVDQVTATHPDGSSLIIVTGKNGAKLTDPGSLKTQAVAIARTLLDAKGIQASTPLASVPFAAVTPAVFGKLLEVNVVTKTMWAWDNGQVVKTYPISAGAPATPTPIGQFKIFSKLPVQDMKGFNANGTKYFQPHVRWISYFLPGGYAVHGNYWRPQSWFGNINSSHGCVSLPDDQAKEVYDFAPLGTTVITHQ